MGVSRKQEAEGAVKVARVKQRLELMKLKIKHGIYPKIVDKRGLWLKGRKRIGRSGKFVRD